MPCNGFITRAENEGEWLQVLHLDLEATKKNVLISLQQAIFVGFGVELNVKITVKVKDRA